MEQKLGCNRRAAFTLTEITVVLAILLLLGALLFPAFARVREKGRQTTCQQNLRQIYLAVQQYVADQNGHFPTALGWDIEIASYVKNPAVFRCPTQIHPHTDPDPVYARQDYGLNALQLNDVLNLTANGNWVAGKSEVKGTNEARFEQTARIVLFWEHGHDGKQPEVALPTTCGELIMGGFSQKVWLSATLHNAGSNLLFLDGHTKWLNSQKVAAAVCDSINSGPISPVFRRPR